MFDILYTSALNAMVDGYFREAVTTFMASLERFREYYFHGIMHKHGVQEVEVDAAWKMVERQSERQLGWFIGAYLLDKKVLPTDIETNKKVGSFKFVEFRNNIIHKGLIPSKEEAVAFGQIVYDYIMEMLHSKEFFEELNGKNFSPYYFMQFRKITKLDQYASNHYAGFGVIHQGGTTFLTDPRLRSTVTTQMASVAAERETARPIYP